MVSCLEAAIGATFEGYKGGEFEMDGTEEIFLAFYGCCGSRIKGVQFKEAGKPVLILNDDYI